MKTFAETCGRVHSLLSLFPYLIRYLLIWNLVDEAKRRIIRVYFLDKGAGGPGSFALEDNPAQSAVAERKNCVIKISERICSFFYFRSLFARKHEILSVTIYSMRFNVTRELTNSKISIRCVCKSDLWTWQKNDCSYGPAIVPITRSICKRVTNRENIFHSIFFTTFIRNVKLRIRLGKNLLLPIFLSSTISKCFFLVYYVLADFIALRSLFFISGYDINEFWSLMRFICRKSNEKIKKEKTTN